MKEDRDGAYLIASLFFFQFAIGSKEVREVPYDMVKTRDQCFVIFPYGIDSVFLDISMHPIAIMEIENKISLNRIRKKTSQMTSLQKIKWHNCTFKGSLKILTSPSPFYNFLWYVLSLLFNFA